MRSTLYIQAIRSRPVIVPMKRPLKTSAGEVTRAPLLLIDLQTNEGVTGHSYLFGVTEYTLKPLRELVTALGEIIEGDSVAPFEIERKLRSRTMLPGPYYLLGMALAGIDMACWDTRAAAAGMPLAVMLGGSIKEIPAYNSNGLGIMNAQDLVRESVELVEEGFRAIKLRLGRPTAEADVDAVRAVRSSIPDDVLLMVDFNQALSVQEAIRRGRMLDEENLYWIEEPVRADDFSGCAQVSAGLHTPVQIGENFCSVHQMQQSLMAHSSDYVMPDVQRIGGVSGWLRAAALAHAFGCEMSSHLFPEISSHLLAITPTSHWLEYTDWANPVLEEAIMIRDGRAVIPERPGTGLSWDESAVAKFGI